MKFSRAAAMLGACVVLTACASHSSANADDAPQQTATTADPGVFQYLFDRKSVWKENPTQLPALPQTADLMPFNVSAIASLNYAIDARSVSVGSDGVVRYTIVISSPEARNVRYEGIRCDTYEWKLYSGANDAGTEWDHASTDWSRIEASQLNAYHAALYSDYFCASKMPLASASTIVKNLRYERRNDLNQGLGR